MAAKTIRVRIKSYDHKLLDESAQKIVALTKQSGATVVGPIPLPTEKQVFTILRAVHKDKDSREQFEIRTHKRLIIITTNDVRGATMSALTNIDLPAGVDVSVRL